MKERYIANIKDLNLKLLKNTQINDSPKIADYISDYVPNYIRQALQHTLAGIRRLRFLNFKVETKDNVHMKKTLEAESEYTKSKSKDYQQITNEQERALKIEEIREEFQNELSRKVEEEQNNLILSMQQDGINILEILEDKNGSKFYPEQIFATDTGQYCWPDDDEFIFIPANFANEARQGEERLAIHQAINLGATIKPLYSKTGEPLKFEGGDIRPMPGKKLFFMGQGFRSDPEVGEAIAKISRYPVIRVKLLKEEFYHLDCCFLPLINNAAVVYEGEYVLDPSKAPEKVPLLDENNWPMLIPGTETMDKDSRALIRALYPEKLVLITKEEALAFATNAALIQNTENKHFYCYVNGNKEVRNHIEELRSQIKCNEDEIAVALLEKEAILAHDLSLSSKSLQKIEQYTGGQLKIVEVAFKYVHSSGGSIRCTIQEIPCKSRALMPSNTNPYHAGNMADSLDQRDSLFRRNSLVEKSAQKNNLDFRFYKEQRSKQYKDEDDLDKINASRHQFYNI